jgi:hypothetical protein
VDLDLDSDLDLDLVLARIGAAAVTLARGLRPLLPPSGHERARGTAGSIGTTRSPVPRSGSRPKARPVGENHSRMNFRGFSGIPFTRTS